MEQWTTASADCDSGSREKDQKPLLTCAGPSCVVDDAGPNTDDVGSSSTSSTMTENAEVRPNVALSAETSPMAEVASSVDVTRRVSTRYNKREEMEPSDRKLLP